MTMAGQERDDDDDPTFMLPSSVEPAASDCSHMDLDEPCKASDDLTALYDTDYSSDDLLLDCEPSTTGKDLCFDDESDHLCAIEDDAYMHSPAHISYFIDEDSIEDADAQAAGEGPSTGQDDFDCFVRYSSRMCIYQWLNGKFHSSMTVELGLLNINYT